MNVYRRGERKIGRNNICACFNEKIKIFKMPFDKERNVCIKNKNNQKRK